MTTTLRQVLRMVPVIAVLWLVPWGPPVTGKVDARNAAAVPRSSQNNGSVRPAPAGHRVGATPGRKGATDYWLESQTVRLTTRFDDETVAVGARGSDGNFETKLTDRSGSEVARFRVNRSGADADAVLQYVPQSGAPLHVYGDQSVKPTLAWANAQAYSLLKDRVGSEVAALEWQNGVIRRKGGARRDADGSIAELHTEWAAGLSARLTRKNAVNMKLGQDRVLNGDVLVSHLVRDGVRIGVSTWFVNEKVLVWDIPGITRGILTADHLGVFGGWPFTPDAEWLNLQTIAFYHFKTAMDRDMLVARNPPSPPRRAWPAVHRRLVDFFVTPVLANEPGCDGLHWLDGTSLRYCCDRHDLCYEKSGCTSSSWWQFWSSWSCTSCNVSAVSCFSNGGAELPYHWTPW